MNPSPSTTRKRSIDLRISLSLALILVAGLVIGLVLSLTYFSNRARINEDLEQRLLNIVTISAMQQNGETLLAITSSQDSAYEQIRQQNLEIIQADADIARVYILRIDSNGLYVVVDAAEPGDEIAASYGERYPDPGPVLAGSYRILSEPIVEQALSTSDGGAVLSAYAPIHTAGGQLAGILGIDLSVERILVREQQALIQLLAVFAFILPVAGIAGWLLGDNLALPIRSLTQSIERIARGELGRQPQVKSAITEMNNLGNALFSMSHQMQSLVENLEQRVGERTRDLEKRSTDLQTVARIGRDISLTQNVDELLNRTARLIRERFSIYHVGIFISDENNEYAILRAAGGEAGQLMLANKHRLRIGEVGIVGYVAKTGEPRIALDVGEDAVHFRNPLLPYTRSEMTLPLKIEDRVIGALDVQSDKVNAFDQDHISIMQILADQLSVAFERARLIQELAQNVSAVEQSSREYTARTWRAYMQQTSRPAGYRYEGIAVEPIAGQPPESLDTLTKGKLTAVEGETGKTGSLLAVPIRLRGQTLGTLSLLFQEADVPQETVQLVEEASDRLALALENARLVQDAQRLATRERQINLISAQAQQSTDMETVLQNTIRELGNTLGVPKTFIQIGLVPPKGPRDK